MATGNCPGVFRRGADESRWRFGDEPTRRAFINPSWALRRSAGVLRRYIARTCLPGGMRRGFCAVDAALAEILSPTDAGSVLRFEGDEKF